MKRTILAAGALLLAAIAAPAFAPPSFAHGPAGLQETITPVFEGALPNVPGKSLIAIEVEYPPGAASPSHTHPKSAFIYAHVLSGEIISAVDGEAPRLYKPGQGWHEAPGAHHRVSRNASQTKPAKLLAIFIVDPGERQLVFPDPH